MKNQPFPGTLKHLPSISSKGAGYPLPCNVTADEKGEGIILGAL